MFNIHSQYSSSPFELIYQQDDLIHTRDLELLRLIGYLNPNLLYMYIHVHYNMYMYHGLTGVSIYKPKVTRLLSQHDEITVSHA